MAVVDLAARIRKLAAEGETFAPDEFGWVRGAENYLTEIPPRWTLWTSRVYDLVRENFRAGGPIRAQLEQAVASARNIRGNSPARLNGAKEFYLSVLAAALEAVDQEDANHEIKVEAPTEPATQREPQVISRKVFVVHGHDGEAREAVARCLSNLGFEPIILTEQPDQSRTIIEKFEAHADVAFAVVLLTPDDVGGKTATDLRPRARQNVILELGYFIGKLGRKGVLALYRGDVELPSDYHGVLYTPLDRAGAWKLKLGQELRAAGFDVDLNRL